MLYDLIVALVVAGLIVWTGDYFRERWGRHRTQKLLVQMVINVLKQGVAEVAATGQIMEIEKLHEAGTMLVRQKYRDVLPIYPTIPEPVVTVNFSNPEIVIVCCTCGDYLEEATFNGTLFKRTTV